MSPDEALAQFADYVVRGLFSVSLSLEGARSILGKGPANDRVAAATDETDRMIRDIRTMVFRLAEDRGNHAPDPPPPPPGGDSGHTRELLDGVVNSLFQIGLLLQAAPDLPRDTARLRIADALRRLNEVGREVSAHTSAGQDQEARPSPNGRPLEGHGRLWETADRAARLRERVAQAAHALQVSAADTATLVEQHAAIARPPGRMDYQAEVKRWRAFADQAGQLAKRWEEPA